MTFPRPLTRQSTAEILDGSSWTDEELRLNLRDIRRVNRFGGGTAAVVRELPALTDDISPKQSITILDVATGSADIPIAIAEWAATRNRVVQLTVSDWSEEILAVARVQVGARPGFEFARFDARALSLPDRSVDLALCSMALHHFEPDEAVLVLAEMKRVARIGCVVNDLTRSRSGHLTAIATSRLFTRNRLTRHDAPLSVLRAYTVHELTDLLAKAGWDGATVQRRPLFRMTAVWKSGL